MRSQGVRAGNQGDPGARRGRPSAAEVVRRRGVALDVLSDLLAGGGASGATMSAVAVRAGVSKESLYSWFGTKEGMIAALATRNAAAVTERLAAATEASDDPAVVLVDVATGLLSLLVSPGSVALNRAAMAELPARPAIAQALLEGGRHTVGPLIEAYLVECDRRGTLRVPDPAVAFDRLYGLVVADTQVRVLLGEQPPSRAEIRARAERAVRAFLIVLATG